MRRLTWVARFYRQEQLGQVRFCLWTLRVGTDSHPLEEPWFIGNQEPWFIGNRCRRRFKSLANRPQQDSRGTPRIDGTKRRVELFEQFEITLLHSAMFAVIHPIERLGGLAEVVAIMDGYGGSIDNCSAALAASDATHLPWRNGCRRRTMGTIRLSRVMARA